MRRFAFAIVVAACGRAGEPVVAPAPQASAAPPASASASATAPAPAPASAFVSAPAPAVVPWPPPSAIPSSIVRCTDPDPPPCIHLDSGQCTLIQDTGKRIRIPCPDRIRPDGDACERMQQCHGTSDEGCCVGCNHPMRSRISPACAKRIEAAKDCAAVSRIVESQGCVK